MTFTPKKILGDSDCFLSWAPSLCDLGLWKEKRSLVHVGIQVAKRTDGMIYTGYT